ncbi:MAG: flagellar biosynthetic protein FliR [Planctomycetota bacterium]|nr:flagellar biosynthetic protein FliR [Planctomycetota bacterium]
MNVLETILPHVVPFFATLARMSGIFIFAPLLSSAMIPTQVKVILSIAMAFAVYPTIDHATWMTTLSGLDIVGLIPLIFGEALIGFTVGLLATIPVLSIQMGGLLMGQQMGLGIASIFNPALESDGDVVGQILLYLAIAMFLSLGGIEYMHLAVVNTFANVPPGGFAMHRAPLELLVGLITSGSELALRVAAPVLCIVFLETLATGFLMKTVPQLNILSFGFPVKILVGLLMLIAAIGMIGEALHVELAETLDIILIWAENL